MTARGFCLALLLVGAVLGPVPEARAEEPVQAAEDLFQAGVAAYGRGEFTAAARAFEAANDKAPRGATILNAARAWDAAKDGPRAADAYASALRIGGLSEPERAEAERRSTQLEHGLGTLDVAGASGTAVSVAHVEGAVSPISIHLEPGRHEVELVDSNGKRSTKSVQLRAGERLTLELPEPERQATVQSRPSRHPPPRAASHHEAPSASPLPWVLLGGGVVAAGVATYLGISALDARDTYVESNRRDVDAYDRAKSLRLWTNVAWGASLVLGGSGALLLLTGAKEEMPKKMARGVVCAPGALRADCFVHF